MRDMVTWYDSPESVNAAFIRSLEQEVGEPLHDAQWGAEDADGNPVDLTVEQMIEGKRAQGMWGFCDGERIHAWIAPDADEASAVHFMAHELAHLRKADAPPIAAEEEAWAELVGSIAAEAFTLVRSRRSALAAAPRVEVTEAMRLALDVLTWQMEARSRCGDPDAECPLQDACKPTHDHTLAITALRAALARDGGAEG